MINYNETTGPGSSWTRANRVMILNPLDDSVGKQISFFEETVAKVGDTTIKADSGYCNTYYTADKLIELINPETGEPTGETITQGKVYQAIYSLYLAAAKARDQQMNPLQPPQQ